MAMILRGFDSPALQFNEASWAEYQRRASGSYNGMRLWSGGAVTPGTGRAVNVAVLDAIMPGVWFVSDAVTSVSLALPAGVTASASRRTYYIVAEGDWAANTVTLKAVPGTAVTGSATPTAPTLTQNAGTTWQMPLARATLADNAATVAATNVEQAAPLLRAARKVTTSDIGADSFGTNALGRVVSSGTATDPGWPYWLDVDAAMLFSGDSGYARLDVTLDGSGTNGVDQSGVMTTNSGEVTARASRFMGPLTGTHAIALTVSASGVAAGVPFATTGGAANYFIVRQIPA